MGGQIDSPGSRKVFSNVIMINLLDWLRWWIIYVGY